MSRLYFAPIAEAFYLGSDQIKDTQAEIAKLKTIIGDSALVKKSSFTNNGFNGFTKERFGEVYSTTVSSNIKNYLFFFIAGMVVYLLLEKYIKK
jgi:hypothetical protein